MMRWLGGVALGCVVFAGAYWLAMPGKSVAQLDPIETLSGTLDESLSPTRPLPAPVNLPAARVALGEQLFKDVRLSADGQLACVSCHPLERGGADGQRVSTGINGAQGTINAPTVFNAAFNFVQFWDGRAGSLAEQAAGPIHNPVELGSSWADVIARLSADEALLRAFRNAYPDGALNAKNIADAIASYERSLITVDSPFDRFLQGDKAALSELEQEGYRRFRELGCISCHQGVLFGGNMFQKFGVMGDYFARRPLSKADLGRYNVTGRDEDRHVFKVPSLRNVALTAPYFHDGSAATLEDAIPVMGRYQLGRELSPQDIKAISAFLHTLTGKPPGGVQP